MATPSPRPFKEVIEGLITDCGSMLGFADAMGTAGASVGVNTVRTWRRGAKPARARHILAIANMAGISADDLLIGCLTPEEMAALYPADGGAA